MRATRSLSVSLIMAASLVPALPQRPPTFYFVVSTRNIAPYKAADAL